MYRQYRDVPRIDQPVAMMAQLRIREMQCTAAEVRLARQARQSERSATHPWLFNFVQTLRRLLMALPRRAPRTGVRTAAGEVVYAPDA